MLQAAIKDNRRRFNIFMDKRLLPYILDAHITPKGLVIKPGKKDRPVFSSTFRPYPAAFAINDWVDITKEPQITWKGAVLEFLIYIYRMCITYPTKVIYIGDDGLFGAFCHCKYHPDLVALHMADISGHLVASTGSTFGNIPNPGNFDVPSYTQPVPDGYQLLGRRFPHDSYDR